MPVKTAVKKPATKKSIKVIQPIKGMMSDREFERHVAKEMGIDPVVKALFGKLPSAQNIPTNKLPTNILIRYLYRPTYAVKWDENKHTKPLIRENREYHGVFVAGRIDNKVIVGWAYDSRHPVNKKESLNIACDRLLKSDRYRELPNSLNDAMSGFIERCERYYNNEKHKDKYEKVSSFVVSGTDIPPGETIRAREDQADIAAAKMARSEPGISWEKAKKILARKKKSAKVVE